MHFISTFSERLNEQICELDETPEMISKVLCINLSQIYCWLRDENKPTMSNLIKLADHFNCSVDYLAGRVDNSTTTKSSDSKFTLVLSSLLKNRKLSQYKLATQLGISRSTIHFWLHGKTEPLLDNLILLADYFDCSIDFLVGRE